MVSSVLSSHVEDVVYFDLEILNNVFFPIGIVEELFIIIIIYFFLQMDLFNDTQYYSSETVV